MTFAVTHDGRGGMRSAVIKRAAKGQTSLPTRCQSKTVSMNITCQLDKPKSPKAYLKPFDWHHNRQITPEGDPKAGLPICLGPFRGQQGGKAPLQCKAAVHAITWGPDLELKGQLCSQLTRVCNAKGVVANKCAVLATCIPPRFHNKTYFTGTLPR